MNSLLDYFFRLLRFRANPQDLPTSSTLLILLAGLSVVIGTVNGIEFLGGAWKSLQLNLMDAGLLGLMVAITLQVVSKSARLIQSLSAIYGVNALMGLVMLVISQISTVAGSSAPLAMIQLIVLVWLHVVIGHILRHALEVTLGIGVMLALTYSALSFMAISPFFPVS
ncbi:MAG: hypothetical protein ACWA5Q_02070 [bacterium]